MTKTRNEDAEYSLVIGSAGQVQIVDPSTFLHPGAAKCREFLHRVLAVDGISSVHIQPPSAKAEIRLQPGRSGSAAERSNIYKELIAALKRPPTSEPSSTGHLNLTMFGRRPIDVFQYRSMLSTWQIVHDMPGRLRLRQARLRRQPAIAENVELDAVRLYGVTDVSYQPLTGTLLIRYEPDQISRDSIVSSLESSLRPIDESAQTREQRRKWRTRLTCVSLGIATVGQFYLPPLLPISGALLFLSNLDKFELAWQQLRQRRLGEAAVYSSIIGLTLASGQFFPAALMGWFIEFWDRAWHQRWHRSRCRLAARFEQRPVHARVPNNGCELMVPLDRLQPGCVVKVSAGEMIAADGIVTYGQAVLDEGHVHGHGANEIRTSGDSVFAGSRVIAGELQFRVTTLGHGTRSATISRAITAATTPRGETLRQNGRSFSDRAAVPTLATAGFGLLTGDITTACAILRPDYASGPAMSAHGGRLQFLQACAGQGVLVRDADVLKQLDRADELVIDQESFSSASPQELTELSSTVDQLRRRRRRRKLTVHLLCTSTEQSLAEHIRPDFVHVQLSDADKTSCVRNIVDDGSLTVLLCNGTQLPDAARAATVAISHSGVIDPELDPAHVILMRPQWLRLEQARLLTRSFQRRHLTNCGYTLIPNMAIVAGALFLGFTSLYAVVLTNFGTYRVYARNTSELQLVEPAGTSVVARGHLPAPMLAAFESASPGTFSTADGEVGSYVGISAESQTQEEV